MTTRATRGARCKTSIPRFARDLILKPTQFAMQFSPNNLTPAEGRYVKQVKRVEPHISSRSSVDVGKEPRMILS